MYGGPALIWRLRGLYRIVKPVKHYEHSHLDLLAIPLHPMRERLCQPLLGMIAVDAYSKWLEVVRMSTTTTERTIEALCLLFSRYGLPQVVVSNNEFQFTSKARSEFIQSNGIVH